MVTVYLFGLGLLLAQYTITGFDASAHVSEETKGARTEAPKAIVRSIYISAIAALVMNLAMIAALPKKGDVDGYTAIAFGGGGDPFLVNAAPRSISSAVGTGAAKLLVFIAHRRPVLLRPRVSHGQQPHDLRLQPRWCVAPLQVLAQDQQEDAYANQLGVARRRPVGARGHLVALPEGRLLDGLLRAHRHLRDRPLHRLRDPHLPAAHQPRLPGRPVEPEGQAQAGRLDVARVDRLHQRCCSRPAVLAVLADLRQQNEFTVGSRATDTIGMFQPEQLQLHRSAHPHRGGLRRWATGSSAARSGSPARRCRAPRKSCWPSSASSTRVEHGKGVSRSWLHIVTSRTGRPAGRPVPRPCRCGLPWSRWNCIQSWLPRSIVACTGTSSPSTPTVPRRSTVIWLGRDGDELLVAHLGSGQKMRNVERDPRVVVSFELPGTSGPGLRQLCRAATARRASPRAAPPSCCRHWRLRSSVRV